MSVAASIFFDIDLPNAVTWFYFSALLAVALFFKFTRLLSMRNLDVLTLFLPMPGLLLLMGGGGQEVRGYLWLLGASGYFLIRCLVDLALVRRPALAPNLNLAGLAWLAAALFVSLVAVATRPPSRAPDSGQPDPSPPIGGGRVLQEQLVAAASQQTGARAPTYAWVERGLALGCHLSIVVGLVLVGWRHFDDLPAGMAAATFYLLLPYTYLLLPSTALGVGRWDHAWPMALMIWTVLAYRRPALAGVFLGVAAGSVFFPVLTFPVWLGFYWKRGAGRFTLSFALSAGLCLAIIAGLLWLDGELPRSLQSAWTQSDWQPWKQPHLQTQGAWQVITAGSHWVYRLPVFLAFMTFVLTTTFWPAPKNLAHVLALSAAVLIGIQFWYADRGGVYVLWYLPFLLLLVFRPNLSAAQPLPDPGDERLARLVRHLALALWRHLQRLRRSLWRRRPQPAARVG